MGIAEVMRALVLAGIALGWTMPARAAECPAPAATAGPARPLTLRQLLALPNQPDPAVEGSSVATIGFLVRVRRTPQASPACAKAEPVFRLWLATRQPYGLKSLASRHRAVVATVPAAAMRDIPGGVRALEKLVGRRIWISGQMTFNAGGRGQMMRTRGTLWELRSLSAIAACPAPACSLAQPPAARAK